MGLQIFNGHLLNCTLHTQAGPTSTGTAFLRNLIRTANDSWPWSSRHVSSPPYFMCLCDIHNHSQELWDCNQNSTWSYTVVKPLITFHVSLIGDLQRLMNSTVQVEYLTMERRSIKQLIIKDQPCTLFNRSLSLIHI